MPANVILLEAFAVNEGAEAPALPEIFGLPGCGRQLSWYSAVEIWSGQVEESDAVEILMAWLEDHRDALLDLECDLKVEILTSFLPEDGSRAIALSVADLELLAELGCRFVHQCSQWLGNREAGE